MNSMVSSLAKTWNGKDFDFAKADGFYKGLHKIFGICRMQLIKLLSASRKQQIAL